MPRVKWGQNIGKPEQPPEPKRRGTKNKPKITSSELAQIEQLAGYGLTLNQIVSILDAGRKDGLSRASFFRQKAATLEIQSAIDRGRAVAEARIGQSLFELATEDKSLAAIIWWERTRGGRYAAVPPPPAMVQEQARLAATPQTILVLPEKNLEDFQDQDSLALQEPEQGD